MHCHVSSCLNIESNLYIPDVIKLPSEEGKHAVIYMHTVHSKFTSTSGCTPWAAVAISQLARKFQINDQKVSMTLSAKRFFQGFPWDTGRKYDEN